MLPDYKGTRLPHTDILAGVLTHTLTSVLPTFCPLLLVYLEVTTTCMDTPMKWGFE